jgi:hypothetical protein
VWARARAHGLKTLAKVQLNNSWECSAVPYIPAPDLAVEHLRRLAAADVTGLMVSWTLGGYPSPILDLAAESYWQAEGASGTSIQGYAERVFGKAAGRGIANAWTVLSRAFPEFPFNVGVLYAAPQNSGPMNLLYAEPTGYKATMVGFPYDHADAWRGVYPPEVFEDQMRRLSLGWHGGLASLEGVRPLVPENRRAAFEDLENATRATYAHFRSAYLQTVFVRLRDRLASAAGDSAPALRHEILAVLDEEIMLARMLHDLVRRDSRIGFEPTQHYYYTLQSLREKAVSCEDLKTIFVVPPAG